MIKKLIDTQLAEFDKWRNDGEHCSFDDSMLSFYDVIMLKEFIKSSILAVEQEVKKKATKKACISILKIIRNTKDKMPGSNEFEFVVDVKGIEKTINSLIGRSNKR
jgi:hypothetical protein